jgi:hypothetical protein
MLARIATIVLGLLLPAALCTAVAAQQTPSSDLTYPTKPVAAMSVGVLEFPVLLEQSVTAGKTAIGTAVQAKLVAATLVNGVVLPKNAVFAGVVTESAEKNKAEPSRLAIRIDSVQWKGGSAQVKVYLTSWYYPSTDADAAQNLQYGPTQSASATWNGQGSYPSQNSKVYQPFPGRDSNQGSAVPDTPVPVTSNHRVAMKNVESSVGSDGAIALASKHSNLKLDKLTTYVFSNSDLLPSPKK